MYDVRKQQAEEQTAEDEECHLLGDEVRRDRDDRSESEKYSNYKMDKPLMLEESYLHEQALHLFLSYHRR